MQENISESLKKYDYSFEKYKEYYKINKKNKLTFKVNLIDDVPVFELKNNIKILMTGDYNLIGVYDKKNKKFRWGWDMIYSKQKNKTVNENENENKMYYIDENKQSKDIILNKEDIILNINNTYYIKKIINYIFDLKINLNNFKELFFYDDMRNIFLHHIINIKNRLQIELILAMTLYITKSDLIWKVNDNDNNYRIYYLLRNVK
jgi:hypothetical protein